eukprot:s4537_g12.t1
MAAGSSFVFRGKSVEDLRRGNRAAVIARLTAFSSAVIHAEWVKGMNTRARHQRMETRRARKRTRCNRGAENTKQKQQQQKEDKERAYSIPVRKLASLILPDHIKRRQTKPDRYSPESTPEDDDESCWDGISLDGSSDLFEYPESIDDNDSIVEVCKEGERPNKALGEKVQVFNRSHFPRRRRIFAVAELSKAWEADKVQVFNSLRQGDELEQLRRRLIFVVAELSKAWDLWVPGGGHIPPLAGMGEGMAAGNGHGRANGRGGVCAEAVERLDDWTMPPTGRKWTLRRPGLTADPAAVSEYQQLQAVGSGNSKHGDELEQLRQRQGDELEQLWRDSRDSWKIATTGGREDSIMQQMRSWRKEASWLKVETADNAN